MPERRTVERAKSKLRHGRSASTAAGELVRTKGPMVRRAAAKKAARTRARHA